ncbi:MAG TPA: hypothetical protein VEA41_00725 [Salinarimonas sp.]|nr:hypothetical protein [Salinarimonas sp.]
MRRAGDPRSPKAAATLTPKLRREAVEHALREKGWDETVLAELIKKTGASRATLFRDRSAILRLLADEEVEGLPERRAYVLGGLRRLLKKTTDAAAFVPAVRLLALEAQILGVDQPDFPEVVEPPSVDTSLEAVLRDTRRLRRRAEAGRSYVAAEKMLEKEHEIVRDIAARDQARREEEMAQLSEEDLVAAVVEAAGDLTEAQKQKLRAALG